MLQRPVVVLHTELATKFRVILLALRAKQSTEPKATEYRLAVEQYFDAELIEQIVASLSQPFALFRSQFSQPGAQESKVQERLLQVRPMVFLMLEQFLPQAPQFNGSPLSMFVKQPEPLIGSQSAYPKAPNNKE